jgi:tetratricopeptide (TPR) repeat protein
MSTGEMMEQGPAPKPQRGGAGFMDSGLNRLILWAAALLVITVIGFGVYYYVDQSGSGVTSMEERQLEAAEQAVRDDPTNLTNRLLLADLYFSSERYDDSVEQYREAVSINDQSTLAHVGLGRALIETGNLDEAAQNFQAVIDLAEKEDISGKLVQSSHYYSGKIAMEQGDPDRAVEQFLKATELERTDSDAWYQLGAAYLAAGKVDESVEALGKAILFVPNYKEAYEKLAEAFEQQGAPAGVLYARGMAAYSDGDFDGAASRLESAIDAAPNMWQAHAGLGLVRESQGQKEAAIVAYQEAVHLNPDDFLSVGGLARLTGAETSGELPGGHPPTEGGEGTEQEVTP